MSPLHQHPLSCSIDQACYDHLIAETPDPHSKPLALSCTLHHGMLVAECCPFQSLGSLLHDQGSSLPAVLVRSPNV